MFPLLLAQDAANYEPPLPGFLPARGSLMLDVVFVALFLILPLMGASIYLARYRRKYTLHKWLQIGIGIVLLLAVAAFEVDIQYFTKWRLLASTSRFWSSGWVGYSLIVHLCFAIPTPFIWIFVIVQALRKFPSPPKPNSYSPSHKFWARLAAIELTMTAVTGWVFYVLAFMM